MDYKLFLKRILVKTAKEKTRKILQYVAIHQKSFEAGQNIALPVSYILNDKEQTSEFTDLICKMLEDSYEWINVDFNGHFFSITLSASAKLSRNKKK